MPERLLMIEDDHRLAAMVRDYLARHQFSTALAETAKEAFGQIEKEPFDLVILDLMLPDADGLNVCRRIRAESSLPVIMLTAKGDPMDRIVGLEIGADDYIPKPFEPRELLAREQIMDGIRAEPLEAFDRSIDVHIARIRAAIEDDPKHPKRLITVRGAGYVFAKSQDA